MSRYIKKRKPVAVGYSPMMNRIQASIKWAGQVRLHQIKEDHESLLAEYEWPPNSGKVYFACASTGLLFDKQSGACRQSSSVSLLIDTVAPRKCTVAGFNAWLAARRVGTCDALQIKRGPKPGGAAARTAREKAESEREDDDEYAEMD